MERIGIIGLGRMGSAMAARFAGQGAEVAGWTRSGLDPARAKSLGIKAADTVPDLVAASDVIVTSLYDDTAVVEVLEALLATDLEGRLIVETSTALPANLTDRAQRVAEAGAMLVDAPISGGPEMVTAGTCGIFMGGEDSAADRAKVALTALTERVVHVGPLGAGLVMKTINNALMQVHIAGLRDLLPLARRAGLPLETVLTVLSKGPAGLPLVTDRIPKILGQDDSVGFPLAGMVKDNDVFQRIIASYGLDAPSVAYAGELQAAAMADGLGDKDGAMAIAHSYDKG